MKKRHLLLLVIPFMFFFSCDRFGRGNGSENDTIKMSVATFVESADSLVGEVILIEGTVLHTCKHGGKRLFLVDNNNDSMVVEVTAGDKIGKFDETLVGSRLIIAGILHEERIDEKYLNEWEAELLKPEENHDAGVHSAAKGHEDAGIEEKLDRIKGMRADIKKSDKDYISNFSIEAISFREVKQ